MITIEDKSRCCGCAACMQVCPVSCIAMSEDCEGFEYPTADAAKCVGCGRCEQVCPVLNQEEKREPLGVYAVRNRDEAVRAASSSGGFFTPLARRVIDGGGVVFGAAFDEDWSVIHLAVTQREELARLRGSKYVQSRVGDTFVRAQTLLKEGREVLFSGTPCQIAGLRNYLGREYDNLITVDLVCHGVPSVKVWRRYLDELLVAYGGRKISSINFRDKRTGWRNYSLTIEINMGDSQQVEHSEKVLENIYLRGFLADLYLRPSCHHCPSKGFSSGSDVTIADYWGVRSYFPQMDDDRGTGLVFVNTPKLDFADLAAKTGVEFAISSIDRLGKNPAVYISFKENQNRRKFFEQFDSSSLGRLVNKYTVNRNSFRKRAMRRVRRVLGVGKWLQGCNLGKN